MDALQHLHEFRESKPPVMGVVASNGRFICHLAVKPSLTQPTAIKALLLPKTLEPLQFAGGGFDRKPLLLVEVCPLYSYGPYHPPVSWLI